MGILDDLKKTDLLARIRQTYPAAVATTATTATTATQPQDSPRPFAVAVSFPGELPAFDDTLSQRELQEIIQSLDWFDRQDARRKKGETEIHVNPKFQHLKI